MKFGGSSCNTETDLEPLKQHCSWRTALRSRPRGEEFLREPENFGDSLSSVLPDVIVPPPRLRRVSDAAFRSFDALTRRHR